MQSLEKILEGVGLSENESKIYLALLNLGKSGITNISKKSGIKRTTIYNYLNPLLEKDFIKRSISGKRILFMAENPKNLIKIFEERKSDFIKKLPLLEGIYNENSTNTNLEFYEGKNGIKKVYEEVYSSGLDVLAFFSPEMFYKYLGEDFDNFLSSLEKLKGGKTKNLLQNNIYGKNHISSNITSNNSKLLPKEFNIEVDILLIKNSIIMISFEPMYAVKLKNKPLSEFHKNIFDYFWKN